MITDPVARYMSVSNNNGTDISHNIQIAAASKHHLVVDVVSSPADQGHFIIFHQNQKKN